MIELKLTHTQIKIQKGQVQPENRISWNSSERANEPRASIWTLNSEKPDSARRASVFSDEKLIKQFKAENKF